jgi:hypothetical protein
MLTRLGRRNEQHDRFPACQESRWRIALYRDATRRRRPKAISINSFCQTQRLKFPPIKHGFPTINPFGMCSRRSEARECRSPMSHRPASASRAPAALRPSRASKLMRHWQKLRGTRSTHCTDATRRRSVSVLFKQRSSANFASRGPLRVKGCLHDDVGGTSGLCRIAADFLRRQVGSFGPSHEVAALQPAARGRELRGR